LKRSLGLVGFWLLGGLAVAQLAWAEDLQEVEAVGVVAVRPDASSAASLRDAAVAMALREVVDQMAMDLLRDEGNVRPVGFEQGDPTEEEAEYGALEPESPELPPVPTEFLRQALGRDPFEFATRFQVVEDRGERPALFSMSSEVESEYVVVVRVSIDRDRIRERLTAAGVVLDRAGDSRRDQIRLALIGLEDYSAYEAIRTALTEDLGMRDALPVEVEPGRLILEMEADRSPSEFLGALRRALPPHLDLIPIVVNDYAATLQVVVLEPEASEPASPDSGRIDTPSPNRY